LVIKEVGMAKNNYKLMLETSFPNSKLFNWQTMRQIYQDVLVRQHKIKSGPAASGHCVIIMYEPYKWLWIFNTHLITAVYDFGPTDIKVKWTRFDGAYCKRLAKQ
jgi:hypothetical protein